MLPSALTNPVCQVCHKQSKSLEDLNKHMSISHNETDDGRMCRLKELFMSSKNQVPSIVPTFIKVKNFDCKSVD